MLSSAIFSAGVGKRLEFTTLDHFVSGFSPNKEKIASTIPLSTPVVVLAERFVVMLKRLSDLYYPEGT